MRTRCNGSTRATVRARRIGKRRKALRACERKDELRCLRGRVAHVGNGLAGAREGHVAGASGRAGRAGPVLKQSCSHEMPTGHFGSCGTPCETNPPRASGSCIGRHATNNGKKAQSKATVKGTDVERCERSSQRAYIEQGKDSTSIQTTESILTNPPRARSAGRSERSQKEHKSARAPLMPEIAPPLGQAALRPRSAQNKGQDRVPEGPAVSASC